MSRLITFRVEGDPVAKGRPRYSPLNKTFRTPTKTANWEAFCKLRAAEAMKGAAPIDGPVWVVITVFLTVPQSWSRKKAEAAENGRVRPTGKPDLDNYAKAVCDACNGIVFRDDSQVCELVIKKRYAAFGAGVGVAIGELDAQRATPVRRAA